MRCARIVQVESSLSIDRRGPWCVVSFWCSYGRSVGRSHAGSFVTRGTYSGQRPTPQALPASLFLSLPPSSLSLSLRPSSFSCPADDLVRSRSLSLAPLITLPFYNAPLCSATAKPCIFLDAMDFPKAFRCRVPFPACLCQTFRDKPKAELLFHQNNIESITDQTSPVNYEFLGRIK